MAKPDYTDDEKAFRGRIIREMQQAKNDKNQNWDEFDGMTYQQYWESNNKAANAYMPPKINREDVRVTTGTTKEKGNTMLSSLLNYNFAPDIEAFDKNDMQVQELGTVMEDMIKKSRILEMPDHEEKRILIYKELLDQGTVFVEDNWLEFRIPERTLSRLDMSKEDGIEWKNKLDKVYGLANSELISGLGVYLGNIREFFMELQPFVVTRRLIRRDVAESIYGTWARWKNVPEILERSANTEDQDNIGMNDWTLEDFQENFVEELKYYNRWTNNFQILLNGTMMFPVRGTQTLPLSSLNGKCDYPIAKGDLEPISRHFAYSKSIASKTKVDQALMDEMMKAVVVKTRKSYKPPMANNTGRSLTRSVFEAGTIHSDVDPTKLQEIGQNMGVTPSEFNTIEWLKTIIDGKSVSPVFEGSQGRGNQTAREIVELKQQSMMKMGIVVLGVTNLEKKMAKLRLCNILKNWTEAVDQKTDMVKGTLKKVYRNVSVDTAFEDGMKGTRQIRFAKQNEMPDDSQVYAEEELLSKVKGVPVRINVIDPEMLKAVEYNWYIEIIPSEKNTNELKRALFMENMAQGFNMFGPQSFNMEYLKQRYAILNGEDPNRLFVQAQMPLEMMGPPQGFPMGKGSPLGQQMETKPISGPTVNTMIGN